MLVRVESAGEWLADRRHALFEIELCARGRRLADGNSKSVDGLEDEEARECASKV